MSFFNKKEEVMEIQLTQYGRYLLSKGKFKPVFYAFSDDEILYDNTYGENKVEIKKESFERIQEDTIRVRPLYDNESSEIRIGRLNRQIAEASSDEEANARLNMMPPDDLYGKNQVDDALMVPDDRKLVRNLIGSSEPGNKYAASWSVSSLNDQSFELPIFLSASGPNIGMRRPQINMILDYDLKASSFSQDETFSMQEFSRQDGTEGSIKFIDGVTLNIDRNQIVLEIGEDNVSYGDENFEVEFFTVDDQEEITRDGTTEKVEILSSLYVNRPGIDAPRNLRTYFEVLYDGEVSISGDYDFETFRIEHSDDEEFCD
jgi:hypothetical protein